MDYEIAIALRLVASAVLGGLVGLERESLNKSAGFRTHTLVCLGSCLIMITSIEMHTIIGNSMVSDPARLAAQVVSGIGFLGAGTIVRSGFGIRGLTTAASLWVVAGIGLAIGTGNYLTAVTTTLIVMFILMYFPRIEAKVKIKNRLYKTIEVLIEDKPGQIGKVTTALGEINIHIRNLEMSEPINNSKIKVTFTVKMPYCLKREDIIERIINIQGVYNVSIT